MSYNVKLTQSQRAAIDYIGRCRGKQVKIGPRLSEYMLRKLKRMGLVMQYADVIMLTYPGERQYTKMHPTSRYRVRD